MLLHIFAYMFLKYNLRRYVMLRKTGFFAFFGVFVCTIDLAYASCMLFVGVLPLKLRQIRINVVSALMHYAQINLIFGISLIKLHNYSTKIIKKNYYNEKKMKNKTVHSSILLFESFISIKIKVAELRLKKVSLIKKKFKQKI